MEQKRQQMYLVENEWFTYSAARQKERDIGGRLETFL